MARAKHTDRSAARRRYRATRPEIVEGAALDSTDAPAERSGPAARARADAEPPRRGMRYAFGAAFRPLDLRGDLAALPQLLRSKWILLTLAIQVVAFGLAMTSSGDPASALAFPTVILFQYFVYPPPMGAAFLVGATAPRASWLLGLIVGVIAAAGYLIVLQSSSSLTQEMTADVRSAAVAYALGTGPLGSALFAALAAWYRRFLALANPNVYRQPGAGRGGSGRAKTRPLVSRTNARRR